MGINLPRKIWVYAERLYLHAYGAHGVADFKTLLAKHDIDYDRDPHPYDRATKISYTFMSEEDYTFADFMALIPSYKYLPVLEEILFDEKVKATRYDGWNYYGEFINEWYNTLLSLLQLAEVKVDFGAQRLVAPEDPEADGAEESSNVDFFKYRFNDPYLDYMCKELNEAHANGLYLSVMFTGRKILESTTVRVMEVVFHKLPGGRYDSDQHELWYNLGKNRYHDFEVLLTNLKANASSFHEDADLVREFHSKVKPLKDETNACVHKDYKIPDEAYVRSYNVPQTLGLARKLFQKYCNP